MAYPGQTACIYYKGIDKWRQEEGEVLDKTTDRQKRTAGNWLRNLLCISDPATRLTFALIIGVLIAILCLWLFAEIAGELLEDKLALFDTRISAYVHSVNNPGVTRFMKIISTVGGSWYVLGAAAMAASVILYRQKQHYWDAVLVQVCLWGGFLFNYVLKCVFKRERPSLERLVDAAGFSFPSGHSMVSFAFYGLLLYLLYINLPRAWSRGASMLLISCLIMLVGISRIYLGVHYPSDVAAGFAAGGAWLAVCIAALETVRHYKERKE